MQIGSHDDFLIAMGMKKTFDSIDLFHVYGINLTKMEMDLKDYIN